MIYCIFLSSLFFVYRQSIREYKDRTDKEIQFCLCIFQSFLLVFLVLAGFELQDLVVGLLERLEFGRVFAVFLQHSKDHGLDLPPELGLEPVVFVLQVGHFHFDSSHARLERSLFLLRKRVGNLHHVPPSVSRGDGRPGMDGRLAFTETRASHHRKFGRIITEIGFDACAHPLDVAP